MLGPRGVSPWLVVALTVSRVPGEAEPQGAPAQEEDVSHREDVDQGYPDRRLCEPVRPLLFVFSFLSASRVIRHPSALGLGGRRGER